MKKLILVIPFLLAGCQTQALNDLNDKNMFLKHEVINLNAKIDKMEDEKLHYCGALAEAMSGGVIEYLGENKFRNLIDQEIVEPMPLENMRALCQDDLETYMDLVKSRR